MSKGMCGIVLTGVIGLFSLIGIMCNGFLENRYKKKISDFIFGMIFSILTMIILLYLIPDVYNYLGFRKLHYLFIFFCLGYIILKIISNYSNNTSSEKLSKKELPLNYMYLGNILLIAFIFYNIMIGTEIYVSANNIMKEAIDETIKISIIDFIIGFILFYLINQQKSFRSITTLKLSSYILAPLIGSIIMSFIGIYGNALCLGSIISILIGMFAFILVNEIILKLTSCKNRRNTIIGIVFGSIIIAISYLI